MEKISGFSLVRNGIKFDYPFLECWRSMLPIVDELVLNVGKSDDDTLAAAQRFAREEGHGKVRIIETVWPLNDPEKKRSGLILSEQTNIALEACKHDWCLYLQADEVLHEDDLPVIQDAIKLASRSHIGSSRKKIEAIVFQYCHFYSSYDVIQNTRSAYRREVRALRRSSGAKSVGDAQSFRKPNGEKLSALLTPARVFHYGWVRTPEAMKEKTVFMDQLYHGDTGGKGEARESVPHTGDNYRYKRFWGLEQYFGSHPAVMKKRILEKGWKWDLKNSPFVFSVSDIKKVTFDLFERVTGHRLFEFKNYELISRQKDAG